MGRVTEPRNVDHRGSRRRLGWRKATYLGHVVGFQVSHRGRRAGHVRKGCPGTWEGSRLLCKSPRFGTAETRARPTTSHRWAGCRNEQIHQGKGRQCRENEALVIDEEQSERLIVPLKPGNRLMGPGGGKGSLDTQNRRRERWPVYQRRKPSQRNKRG